MSDRRRTAAATTDDTLSDARLDTRLRFHRRTTATTYTGINGGMA